MTELMARDSRTRLWKCALALSLLNAVGYFALQALILLGAFPVEQGGAGVELRLVQGQAAVTVPVAVKSVYTVWTYAFLSNCLILILWGRFRYGRYPRRRDRI